jgi:hypothetical protein
MGAQMSRSISITDIVNESLTEVLLESSINCSSQTIVNQEMVFSDIKTVGCDVSFSDISQDANISVNLACAQDTSQESDLQNKFSAKLDEKIESATSGIPIGFSASESASLTKLKNTVKNNISVKNVAECIGKTIVEQKMRFERIEAECNPGQKLTFENIRQTIISTQVNKCIQNNASATKAINDYESEITKVLKSKTEGVSQFAALSSSGVSSSVTAVVLFVVLGLGMAAGSAASSNYAISSSVSSLVTVSIGVAVWYFFFRKEE